MKKTRIGVCCLLRTTFDHVTAYSLFEERVKKMVEAHPEIDFVVYPKMVIEPEDGKAAALSFQENHVDALMLVSGTFHLGVLALIIHNICPKPALLWGFDELPYDGGKIRLNAVCGCNLDASNLYKAGVDDYVVHVGNEPDEDWLKAIKMLVALKSTNVGLIGHHAQGFYNVGVDELHLYEDLGVLLNHYELEDLFGGEASDEEVKKEIEEVKAIFDTKKLSDYQVERVARLTVVAEKFMKKNALDVVAIRCWPEFARNYGVAPCAMMSILQSKGYLFACEGDIEAALSMIAVRAAGEETPFMADLSQVNYQENYALLWHDGVAPCNLWNGKCNRSLETYFAGGKGVTADFVLKEGKMSILRLDTARGKTRLFYEEGDAVFMDKDLSGTYAKVIFHRHVKDVVDTVVYEGVAHHVIMGYIQYAEAAKILARILGWRLIDAERA